MLTSKWMFLYTKVCFFWIKRSHIVKIQSSCWLMDVKKSALIAIYIYKYIDVHSLVGGSQIY